MDPPPGFRPAGSSGPRLPALACAQGPPAASPEPGSVAALLPLSDFQQCRDVVARRRAQQAWRQRAQRLAVAARQRVALREDAIRQHAELLQPQRDQQRREHRITRDLAHRQTGLRARRAYAITRAIIRSTAGCAGWYIRPSSSLLRSTASTYCVKSLLPIARNSATARIARTPSAAAGTSTIAPISNWSGISWPSVRRSRAQASTMPRTSTISVTSVTIGTRMRTGP